MRNRSTNIKELSNRQKKDISKILTAIFKLGYKQTGNIVLGLKHIKDKYMFLRKFCEKADIPYSKAIYELQYQKYYYR